jgi:predicted nucleic acid-binding protein
MKRIFLDSSVLFSAAYSERGYSRDLIVMAIRRDIVLVLSPLVLEETRRNLLEVAPETLPWLDQLLKAVPFEAVRSSKAEVLQAAEQVVLKDAPIIAAAKKAQVDLLVSLDKKHLLGKPELDEYIGLPIVTPEEAVAFIHSAN